MEWFGEKRGRFELNKVPPFLLATVGVLSILFVGLVSLGWSLFSFLHDHEKLLKMEKLAKPDPFLAQELLRVRTMIRHDEYLLGSIDDNLESGISDFGAIRSIWGLPIRFEPLDGHGPTELGDMKPVVGVGGLNGRLWESTWKLSTPASLSTVLFLMPYLESLAQKDKALVSRVKYLSSAGVTGGETDKDTPGMLDLLVRFEGTRPHPVSPLEGALIKRQRLQDALAAMKQKNLPGKSSHKQ
jgi:hypothetical protein